MALRIRLKRVGMKKQPSYRVVVMESSQTRDGRPIAELGHYSPYRKDKPMEIDLSLVDAWMAKGAQPTDTVDRLLRQARRGGAA
ncbi:MAG TPA: 30S ribosomal protein S16 [bacterium]|nr:30S ribosomal protein S16 [bacterium]